MAVSHPPLSDSTSQLSLADSSAPSLCPNSVNSSITIHNIGSLVLIKLTTTNWITWSALFAPIFHRYNLIGIIDGGTCIIYIGKWSFAT
ncbi:unnamed protein product [Malus baccata var. baccata]